MGGEASGFGDFGFDHAFFLGLEELLFEDGDEFRHAVDGIGSFQ